MTATVEGVDPSDVIPGSIKLNGSVSPTSIAAGSLVLNFDRQEAVKSAGTLVSGPFTVFVTGSLVDVPGSPKLFEARATLQVLALIEVEIDIKPGSDDNPINLGSNGNVPVAILGSEFFDVTTVDPATVTLASGSIKTKKNGSPQFGFEDVNGDGFKDMVVHIQTQGLQLTSTDVTAQLDGFTEDGTPILGTDSVRVKP